MINLSTHSNLYFPWFFIYISVSYLSDNHSDKMSQFIYPYTNIPLFSYYLLPFQTGIWHLIWYLASNLVSGILHTLSGIWYLASNLLCGILYTLSGIWHLILYLVSGIKNSLNLIFRKKKP